MWAIGNNTYALIRELYNQKKPLGQAVTGRIFAMYKAIPAQLSKGIKRYSISKAKGSSKNSEG